MADLTLLFQQCIEIVKDELVDTSVNSNRKSNSDVKEKNASFVLKDTFIKEAGDFYAALVDLNKFLNEIRVPYLATNERSNLPADSGKLSAEKKNEIDQELSYRLHSMYEKLKFLQSYETKRQERTKNMAKGGWLESMFGDGEPSDEELFNESISSFRTQVLRFLTNTINCTNKNFESLQKSRIAREKQLSLLNFQNIEDEEDLNYAPIDDGSDDLMANVTVEENDEGTQQLSQQQLVELETENKEFLDMKTNQLKQVEKLHTSMVDIINLQAELSFQLETQGEQIENLLDNQSTVQMDLAEGNKTLNKATKRNKKGANSIIAVCVTLGILVLFADYITR